MLMFRVEGRILLATLECGSSSRYQFETPHEQTRDEWDLRKKRQNNRFEETKTKNA
jgi:hypothetical protein